MKANPLLKQAAANLQTKSANLNGKKIEFQGEVVKETTVDSNSIESSIATIFGSKGINDESIKICGDEMLTHLTTFLEYLKICSLPSGFIAANNYIVANKSTGVCLTLEQIESIKRKGGNIVPQYDKLKGFNMYDSHGVVLTGNKNLVFALRPINGLAYADTIDASGIVHYFPPQDLTGALRFKWMQELCATLHIPMIVLIIKWFKSSLHPTQERRENHLFCISAAKIINYQDDIKDYVKSISKPLSLQLITPSEAEHLINSVKCLIK